MVRAPSLALLLVSLSLAACGGKKPPADPSEVAEGELKSPDDGADKAEKKEKKDKEHKEKKADGDGKEEGKDGEETKSKASLCTGFELDLVAALSHSACELKDKKPTDVKGVDMKGKLVVKVTPSSAKVEPGGKVDLVVQFTNKGKEPLALDFLIDPSPRFQVEAYDAKQKRVDLPAAREPIAPSGLERGATTQSVGRITLVPNGTAHAKVQWEAAKMRWAPEKLKGTPPEMGYPRVAAGPLPKGRYQLKVATPLLNATEGMDHEVSAPRAGIEVGK